MPYNSLRPIREKKGMTVAQLAGKTSISIRTLQSYEAGERVIAPDDLRKLSRVLYASPNEILQPTVPPPPPPPRPIEPAVAPQPRRAIPPAPSPSVEVSGRPPSDAIADEPRRPTGGRPNGPRPATTRPPRLPREATPRVPGPASSGQIEQIRNLARRMGLDGAALLERVGAALESLDHSGARAAIAKLRKEMEESGTWQPRIAEGADQEAEYLGKLRAQRVPIEVQLISGHRFHGIVEEYTPYVIRVRDSETGADVYVRKLAIAYYRTEGPVDDAQ